MFCPQAFKLLGSLLDCSNVKYFQKCAPFNLRRNYSSFFFLFDVRQPSLSNLAFVVWARCKNVKTPYGFLMPLKMEEYRSHEKGLPNN